MKKIIATVLAMVMALALCTTAFAAEVTDKANVATADTGDTVAANVTWNNTGKKLVATKSAPAGLTGGTYWTADGEGLYYVSRMSPESHSSTVATLICRPCSLLLLMGLTSRSEPVRKFSTPFFVEANFVRFALEPVVFCKEPSVRN